MRTQHKTSVHPKTHRRMEAFHHSGDFDFNVFAHTPGPTIQPKVKKEKERRIREPVPTWQMNNKRQRNEEEDGDHGHREEKHQPQKYNPPAKKQHVEEEPTEHEEEGANEEPQNYMTNKQRRSAEWKAHDHESKITNRRNNTTEKPKKKQKEKDDFNKDTKAWEPDEADIANTIDIKETDTMFLGDFSDTGLSKRLISNITSTSHSISFIQIYAFSYL